MGGSGEGASFGTYVSGVMCCCETSGFSDASPHAGRSRSKTRPRLSSRTSSSKGPMPYEPDLGTWCRGEHELLHAYTVMVPGVLPALTDCSGLPGWLHIEGGGLGRGGARSSEQSHTQSGVRSKGVMTGVRGKQGRSWTRACEL